MLRRSQNLFDHLLRSSLAPFLNHPPSFTLPADFFEDVVEGTSALPFTGSSWKKMPISAGLVHENKDKLVLEAELPGIPRESIVIDMPDDHHLTISAKSQSEEAGVSSESNNSKNSGQSNSFSASKRNYFASYVFPFKLKQELINAEYKDGLLRLEIGKYKELQKQVEAAKRRISIKESSGNKNMNEVREQQQPKVEAKEYSKEEDSFVNQPTS